MCDDHAREHMNEQRAEAMRRLNELKQDYAALLAQRVDEIARMWREAAGSDEPREALLALSYKVHSIAGVAGMFGMQETGRAAAELDQALDRQIAAGRASESQMLELGHMIEILSRCRGS